MLYNKIAQVLGLDIDIDSEKITKRYLLDTGNELYPSIPKSYTQLTFQITDTFLYKKNAGENLKIYEKLQKREKDQMTLFVWKSKELQNGRLIRSLKR